MSLISEQLKLRDVATACFSPGCLSTPLEKLPVGISATIDSVCDDARPDLARRLFDLGFIPGTPVSVKRRDLSGSALVIDVGGYELALRAAQARCVRVVTR